MGRTHGCPPHNCRHTVSVISIICGVWLQLDPVRSGYGIDHRLGGRRAHKVLDTAHTPHPTATRDPVRVGGCISLSARQKRVVVTNGSPKINPLATHADARMLRGGRGGRPPRSKGALIHISAKPSRTCVPGTHRVWGGTACREGSQGKGLPLTG